MKQLQFRCILILAVLITTVIKVTGQATMPDALIKSSLNEQFKYLDEHTKIYEYYRAIREDMFQLTKKNVSDTLSSLNIKIAGLNKTARTLNQTIDTLRKDLASTKTTLEEATKSKNSISVIGLEINKSVYNRIMWTILFGLIAALVAGFLVFKRNLSVISNTRKEFQELKEEFETYRKTSREAREKMTMAHFLEMKKLKGE
jgi:DNA repair exonuclease SbcCD ATPase subunit